MIREFRQFILRGNAIDMAIGIILGVAFGRVVTSFVNDIFMPPLGLLLNKVDFTNLFIDLSGQGFATLEEAKAAGAPTLNYGLFFNNLLDFVLVAFAVFLLVQQINRLARATEPEEEAAKDRLVNLPAQEGGAKPPVDAASEPTPDVGDVPPESQPPMGP